MYYPYKLRCQNYFITYHVLVGVSVVPKYTAFSRVKLERTVT